MLPPPHEKTVWSVFAPFADENCLVRFPFGSNPGRTTGNLILGGFDDDPFIVLTETKFSSSTQYNSAPLVGQFGEGA